MNKKGEIVQDNKFHISLIIGTYLLLDVIILFGLGYLELMGVNHYVVLTVDFILEILATYFIIKKGNIRSAVVFYVLLLVSPVFMNVVTMTLIYITNRRIPYTLIILLLFRSGYSLKGNLINTIWRIILAFRLPSLVTTVIITIKDILKGRDVGF